MKAFMYIASISIGIGAAVLWAAQSEFLHLQSPTDKIMMRNTGIFWCLFQIRKLSTSKLSVSRKLLSVRVSVEQNSILI